jgi:class 3 adenylate cyclase/TolB-like protein
MGEGERRIAAIMFTDIVGFSALTQENEVLALELLDEHFELLRPIISKFEGIEIKTMGDSFMLEFVSPLQAVKCAIEFQRVLLKRNLDVPQERQIVIRIGIHLGDVEHRDDDVFGDGVNIASRIQPIAEPGGIAISRQVYDHVHNKIEWELRSLGTPQLKNITTVVEIFEVDLQWDKPGVKPSSIPTQSKLDQRLKIGSVIAVAVIAVVAAFFLIQSQIAPPVVHLEPEEIRSIAVLPFTDLSEAQDQKYFSEGLADEMRNALVKIEGLRVPSYTSSSSNRLEELSLQEIASLMNVEAVLEGTVRKSGDQLRITAQFNRASDDTQLWSETFDKQAGDIFEIQEEIAEAILNKLGYATTPNQQIVETGTTNSEAYNLYIQGRHLWSKRTEAGMTTAIDYFERAIELDPSYAQAYVGLADAYEQAGNRGFLQGDYRGRAEELANQALEINPNLAAAYATLGIIAQNQDDDEAAERLYQKSIELNPNYPSAHHWYLLLLNIQGRRDDAFRHAKIAKDLDPLSPIILINYANQLFLQKDFDNALNEIELIFRLEPEMAGSYSVYSNIHLYLGNAKAGEDKFLEAIELFPNNGLLHIYLALHYLNSEKYGLAEIEAQEAIELLPDSIFTKRIFAFSLVWSGQYARANEYIEGLLASHEDYPSYWFDATRAYYHSSDLPKALEIIESGLENIHPSEHYWRSYLTAYKGAIYARNGNSTEAMRIISELEEGDLVTGNSALQIALIYAALGDSENTLLWMEHTYDLPAFDWFFIANLPDFKPYRDQPGFQEFFERFDMERNN